MFGSRHDLSSGSAGAHRVDVVLSGGVTAHDVDEGLDICTAGSPTFQDIIGDGRDHDATLLGGEPVEEVWPAMQPRRGIEVAHSHDFTFPAAARNAITDLSRNQKLARLWRSSRLGHDCRGFALPHASRLQRGHQISRATGALTHPFARRHSVFERLASAASMTTQARRGTAVALAGEIGARREDSRSVDARRRGGARVARCAAPRVRGAVLWLGQQPGGP